MAATVTRSDFVVVHGKMTRKPRPSFYIMVYTGLRELIGEVTYVPKRRLAGRLPDRTVTRLVRTVLARAAA